MIYESLDEYKRKIIKLGLYDPRYYMWIIEHVCLEKCEGTNIR